MNLTFVYILVVGIVSSMTVYGIAVDHTGMFEAGMTLLYFCTLPITALFFMEGFYRIRNSRKLGDD